MVVLSRKLGEQVVIGANIVVTVTEIIGGRVQIGIEAPRNVGVLRGEPADDPEAVAFHRQWIEAVAG